MTTHLAAVFTQAAAATRSDSATGPATDADALTVNLQELLRLHGEASTAVVLMLLSVATVLPVAGVGTLTLNARWTRRCLHALAWIYRQANRWLKPRWQALIHDRARPGWALWIAVMGFVIFLPIPFGNVLPSLSLVCLSLGWMFRDGLALVLSTLLGISALAMTATFSQLLWQMVQPLTAWVPSLA
jgi:hypothetical protein